MSGSGEGNFALGDNGTVVFCTSNKAKFVFDAGYGVDICYLWVLSDQCGIFGDILVDIRELGGSSTTGVNDASIGRRTGGGNKKRSAERGLSAKNAKNQRIIQEDKKRKNETNSLLRSLINRGCDELVSVKSTEICLIRSTVTDLTMQILTALQLVLKFLPGEEFYQAARDALKLLEDQQSDAKASLVTAISELEELKLRDAALKKKQLKRARSEGGGGGNEVIFIPDDGSADIAADIMENKDTDEISADLNHEPDPDAFEDDTDGDLDESSDDNELLTSEPTAKRVTRRQ